MEKSGLITIIEKLPIMLIAICYIGYMAFEYTDFMEEDTSPYKSKLKKAEKMVDENKRIGKKIKEADTFFRELEQRKIRLRSLAIRLDKMKNTVPERIDVPELLKTIVTEGKKVGLTITGITPTAEVSSELYVAQPFQLKFRGIYLQLLVFLNRLSSLKNVINVKNFNFTPIGVLSEKYMEIGGTLEVRTYRYLSSKADEIATTAGRSK